MRKVATPTSRGSKNTVLSGLCSLHCAFQFFCDPGELEHPVRNGYIISLNTFNPSRWHCLSVAGQGIQPTVLQLLLRYSVEICKCTSASELT